MKILIIGDLHIPQRQLSLPEEFLRLLTPGKVHKILCTGNFTTQEQLNWLKSICKDIVYVKGDYDEALHDEKESVVVKIGTYTIGLIHGHQIMPWGDPERLGEQARNMGVDILISGQTHIPSVAKYEGRLLINPGSATGAYSINSAQTTPSFMILDIRKDQLDIYQYKLNESHELEVLKHSHTMI